MDTLYQRSTEILAADPLEPYAGKPVGSSREGRPVHALRFGSGPTRVSLLAGCHADEPVGPRFLRHLSAYLGGLSADDVLLAGYEWWIVPHVNPDGAERNQAWQPALAWSYDLTSYLGHAVRELPGDDIEFGFPRDVEDREARPENRAVFDWWRGAKAPFSMHVSLHGMAFGAGPWFLIEPAWQERCSLLKQRCAAKVEQLGYRLHDVERRGEKGFFRLGRGFGTRPDSRFMREYFEGLGDPETARLFRPSSMETIRALGGDPLTLVSEMPLFITPGVGETLGPPDPVGEEWKRRIEDWRSQLRAGDEPRAVARAAAGAGLAAVPARDQMILQWTLIAAGLEQLEAERG